jgi:site-specific recombinase XerD
MNCDYIPTKLVERARTGPLAPYIESYISLMKQAGYVPAYVRENLTVLAAFGLRLERWALGVADLNEDVVDRFVRKRYPKRRQPRHVRPTLRRLLAIVREMGIARPGLVARPPSPAEQLLSEYKHFLVQERAISPSTADRWSRDVLRFLTERFGSGPVDTRVLTASDITGFVQRRAHLHGHSMAKILVVAMRSFLRYLEYKGLTTLSLHEAVPSVATWALASLPKYLPAKQVQAVLDHCDRTTTAGLRDYAILLLLARLGLRAGEVVRLELEDIDWDNALITIFGKGGQRAQLPLPSDVGRAIAEYLHGDRPRCSCRRVFIRDYAPRTGFGSPSAIADIVKGALEKAGVESAHRGAHLLRHSLATHMLAKGASLGEIGEILRHRSTDTTAIYAKVQLEALRPLALCWPGGNQ